MRMCRSLGRFRGWPRRRHRGLKHRRRCRAPDLESPVMHSGVRRRPERAFRWQPEMSADSVWRGRCGCCAADHPGWLISESTCAWCHGHGRPAPRRCRPAWSSALLPCAVRGCPRKLARTAFGVDRVATVGGRSPTCGAMTRCSQRPPAPLPPAMMPRASTTTIAPARSESLQGALHRHLGFACSPVPHARLSRSYQTCSPTAAPWREPAHDNRCSQRLRWCLQNLWRRPHPR